MTIPENPQQPEPQPVAQPAAAPYQQPAAAQPVGAVDPGKTLGIVGLVLAFLIAPVGLILGIVARVQSSKAGFKNGIALAAIILGAIFTVGGIIFAIIISIGVAAVGGGVMEAAQACVDGATSVEVAGQIISCEDVLNQ